MLQELVEDDEINEVSKIKINRISKQVKDMVKSKRQKQKEYDLTKLKFSPQKM